MPKISEKLNRRNFNITNKAGQLGRQGVHGPVERREGLIKPKGV